MKLASLAAVAAWLAVGCGSATSDKMILRRPGEAKGLEVLPIAVPFPESQDAHQVLEEFLTQVHARGFTQISDIEIHLYVELDIGAFDCVSLFGPPGAVARFEADAPRDEAVSGKLTQLIPGPVRTATRRCRGTVVPPRDTTSPPLTTQGTHSCETVFYDGKGKRPWFEVAIGYTPPVWSQLPFARPPGRDWKASQSMCVSQPRRPGRERHVLKAKIYRPAE